MKTVVPGMKFKAARDICYAEDGGKGDRVFISKGTTITVTDIVADGLLVNNQYHILMTGPQKWANCISPENVEDYLEPRFSTAEELFTYNYGPKGSESRNQFEADAKVFNDNSL